MASVREASYTIHTTVLDTCAVLCMRLDMSPGQWPETDMCSDRQRARTFLGISAVLIMSTTFGSSFFMLGLMGSALASVPRAWAARAGARKLRLVLVPIMLMLPVFLSNAIPRRETEGGQTAACFYLLHSMAAVTGGTTTAIEFMVPYCRSRHQEETWEPSIRLRACHSNTDTVQFFCVVGCPVVQWMLQFDSDKCTENQERSGLPQSRSLDRWS